MLLVSKVMKHFSLVAQLAQTFKIIPNSGMPLTGGEFSYFSGSDINPGWCSCHIHLPQAGGILWYNTGYMLLNDFHQ